MLCKSTKSNYFSSILSNDDLLDDKHLISKQKKNKFLNIIYLRNPGKFFKIMRKDMVKIKNNKGKRTNWL